MIVIARVKIQSGKEAEFEKVVTDVLTKVEKEEGTLRYSLNKSTTDPSEYVFYEKYADQDSMNFHMSTPYFKEMSGTLAAFLDGAPVFEMFGEVVGMTPKE